MSEMDKLGKRAVACRRWRWMGGMRALRNEPGESGSTRLAGIAADEFELPATDYPDLTDPATLGCLLALVREAWGCPTGGRPEPGVPWFDTRREGDVFIVYIGTTEVARGGTEAEALVAALEVAP